MIRTIFFFINYFFWTFLLGFVSIFVGIFDHSGRTIGRIVRLWAQILLRAGGIRYRIFGLEKLDPNQNYFFVGNHESAFDILLSYAGLRYCLVSIAKKELKKIPIMGWAMVLAKHIFVDRTNYRKTIKSLEEAEISLKKYPRSVLLFPEGTRSPDGEIHRFKRGGLNLAVKVGMPVIPMTFCGTRNIMAKRGLRVHSGEIELRLGHPIDTTLWKDENPNSFAQVVREKVVAMKNEWLHQSLKHNFVFPPLPDKSGWEGEINSQKTIDDRRKTRA